MGWQAKAARADAYIITVTLDQGLAPAAVGITGSIIISTKADLEVGAPEAVVGRRSIGADHRRPPCHRAMESNIIEKPTGGEGQ